MTLPDPATGWFEKRELLDKSTTWISQIFNSVWLAHYPRLWKIIFDNGNEVKKDFLPLLKDFHIKLTQTNIKNARANAVLETVVHEVLGGMLRTNNL